MTDKAFIFVDDPSEDGSEIPRSMIVVAGVPVLERQLRQLRTLGINTVVLLSRRYPEYLHERLGDFSGGPEHVEVLDVGFLVRPLLDDGEMGLVLEEGILLDPRILDRLFSGESPSLAWFEGEVARYGATAGIKIAAGHKKGMFASVALVSSVQMREAQESSSFQDSPLRILLGSILADPECQWLAVDNLENEEEASPSSRALWRPVLAHEDSRMAGRALLAKTPRSDGDFPDRFIYDLPAGPMALGASKWRYPLLAIRGITFALGVGVAALFYWGFLGLGLAGALVFGLMVAVGHILTRLNDQYDPAASLFAQALDSLEYLWYLAMAYSLWVIDQNPLSWALVILIILFAFASSEQHYLEKKLKDAPSEDMSASDRLIRLFGASRNTRIWLLVPFALTDFVLAGLWTLAIYTALSFFVVQRRTFHRLARSD